MLIGKKDLCFKNERRGIDLMTIVENKFHKIAKIVMKQVSDKNKLGKIAYVRKDKFLAESRQTFNKNKGSLYPTYPFRLLKILNETVAFYVTYMIHGRIHRRKCFN